MILQLKFPNIDPVFLRLGPVQLRWYGLMYMISFIAGYFMLKRLAKLKKMALSTDDLYDLLFFLILGVMVGGRLGYVLFYDFGSYIERPIEMLYVWEGGLVFFGEDGGAFMAVDASSGKPLWHFPANHLWKASPMTYVFDGRQYVAVAVGPNIIAFGLVE